MNNRSPIETIMTELEMNKTIITDTTNMIVNDMLLTNYEMDCIEIINQAGHQINILLRELRSELLGI